jgi:hypothetical protein
MYGNDKKFTIRKVTLQTLMCLLNYTVRNILWWTISGLFTGLIALIFVRVCLFRHKNSNIQWFDNDEEISLGGRRISFWRSSYISIRNGLSLVCCLVPVLLLFNSIYTREMFVDPTTLNQLSHDRYLFTFVIMTAPRRGGNPPFLTQTLASYIENWPAPELIEPGSVYDRMQIVVYTHFTNHSEFDSAHSLFSADPKGKHYIKWMREEGSTLNQRMHVSKALSRTADQFQSTYITLIEDDFPVCGPREWKQIERVVYQANQQVPSHCGVFVGTGGR